MAKPDLLAHVKFGRLQRALTLRRFEALGVLEALWQHCWSCSDDVVGTAADLAWIVDWPIDDAARLAAGLVAAGFLDALEAGADAYRVHDCWRHAPGYAKQRAARQAAFDAKNNLGHDTPVRSGPVQEIKSSGADAPPPPAHDAPEQGALGLEAPAPVDAPRPAAVINARVLARLCHEIPVVDRLAWADAADALKWQAARYRVPYDGPSGTAAFERVARGRGAGFAQLVGVGGRGT